MLTATELALPLARYAERFHAELGDGHHVASPLGAWLLLALAASAARSDERAVRSLVVLSAPLTSGVRSTKRSLRGR
jgi:hypothetical protein